MSTPLLHALQNPTLYPHPVRTFAVLETHISWVLLTGDFAYKIKKPVDLGFLDFSTLEKRRTYCRLELELNRRFAPEVYCEVITITGTVDAPRLNGVGVPLEYALKMRQFDQSARLDNLLARDAVTGSDVDALAQTLATFHRNAPRAAASTSFGSPDAVWEPVAENFAQIDIHALDAETQVQMNAVHAWCEAEFARLHSVLQARQDDGFIRECHGDLHTRNIVRLEGMLTPFDCIEFSENLRWIDVINEIAFLVMDLDALNRPLEARRVLNAWLEHTGDYSGVVLLPFYLCYRAMVRAKIALSRTREATAQDRARFEQEARRYVALAHAYTRRGSPVLWIMHGVSGSGKSTVALHIVELLGAVRVRSDVERKRMFNLPPDGSTASLADVDAYSATATERVYERLCRVAAALIRAGRHVVLDATFLKRAQRDAARTVAAHLGIPSVLVSCRAPLEVLTTRIEERIALQRDASEADTKIVRRQLMQLEPLNASERADAIEFEAQRSIDSTLLASRLAPWAPELGNGINPDSI